MRRGTEGKSYPPLAEEAQKRNRIPRWRERHRREIVYPAGGRATEGKSYPPLAGEAQKGNRIPRWRGWREAPGADLNLADISNFDLIEIDNLP